MLITSPPPSSEQFDICVVGAGPVGLSLAIESSRLGLKVLLLEAGPYKPRRRLVKGTGTNVARLASPRHHAKLVEATSVGIGGTSSIWGGKCVPFGPIDFEERGFVPRSRWPIRYDDVARWHADAARYLQCGLGFTASKPTWSGLGPVLLDQQERWSRQSVLAGSLGRQAAVDPRITLLCGATVTGLRLSPDRSAVVGAELTVDHQAATVQAGRFVLAGGGLKTTQLLLSVQRQHPELFGGAAGQLGRGYAGHLTGSIADIVLSDPGDFAQFDLQPDMGGHFVRRRLTLSDEVQRRERLLNTAFYLGNLPFYDHHHGSGALSAMFLALRAPVIGRWVSRRDTRQRNRAGSWGDLRHHLENIGRSPWQTSQDVAAVVRRRWLARPGMKVFVVPNRIGTYALRYHAEQTCRPENRIRLTEQAAGHALPALDIRYSYSHQDVDSVLRAHTLLDEHLRGAGHGYLTYRHAADARASAVLAQASDGYHQIGTTAMSDEPAEGVVNGDLRVHGLVNLFVASSSVFATAGEANPTFTAVCLAVRLAHHLSDRAAAFAAAADHARPRLV